MKKHRVFILIIMHGLLLLIAYVLQSMVMPYLRLFGLAPVLMPMVCVAAAIFEGRTAGGVTGLLAGMLCDLSYNRPISTFTLLLTVIGLLAGFLAETVITQSFPSFVFCCAAALLITAFAQMFSLLFFEGVNPRELFLTALFQTIYSLAFTPLFYFYAKFLKKL